MRLAANRENRPRDTSDYTGLAPSSKLLPQLKRVRSCGAREWMASCPTHHHPRGDVNPSLKITEDTDGTLLLHCFAHQCEAAEIMDAAGLDYKDIYPEFRWYKPEAANDTDTDAKQRKHIDYKGLLQTLDYESMIVITAARKALDSDLTNDDRQRLENATARISRIALIAEGVE